LPNLAPHVVARSRPRAARASSLVSPADVTVHEVAERMSDKTDRRMAALQGAGILLVVIGHAEGLLPAERDALVKVDAEYAAFIGIVQWIYSFHMPLFFAMSGSLLHRATLRKGARAYPSWNDFVASKAERLLLPYVVISSVAYPIKVLLSRFALRPIQFTLHDYVWNLVFPWENTIIFFWFLSTLWLMFATAPFCLRAAAPRWRDALLAAVAVGLYFLFPHHPSGALGFFNLGGLLHNYVFFVAGFLGSKYAVARWLVGRHFLQLASLAASVCLVIGFREQPIAMFAASFAGMAFVTVVIGSPLQTALARLGDVSFTVYLLSWFPQIFVRVVGRSLHLDIWWIVLASIASAFAFSFTVVALRDRVLPSRLRLVLG
jgi:fucose 4-O-acetylase-like acetyltransferase